MYIPNISVIDLLSCLPINVMHISKRSLHTCVSVAYAAANQFACVNPIKDIECGSEIHYTQRRKSTQNHESRVCFIGSNPGIYTLTRFFITQILKCK